MSVAADKICPECKVVKPTFEFGRCAAKIDGLSRTCRACLNAYAAARRGENPERVKAIAAASRLANREKAALRNKQFYAKNAEAMRQRARVYREQHPEAHKAATMAWRAVNKERHAERQKAWSAANIGTRKVRRAKYREQELEASRRWKSENKAACVAMTAKRTAAKKSAVPLWADLKAIKDIYRKARETTVETGIKHHVDHIVPLQSHLVCGLHWEGNLQILSAFDNQSKRNRHWPDMLYLVRLDPIGASADGHHIR